jgi:hypothetical protein
MPKTAVAMLATVLAAGLIAAGCGGDDDDDTAAATPTPGGEPPSKSEFIQEADAICSEGDQEIDQAAEQLGPGRPSDQELEQFTTGTLVPGIQQQIDDLRALTPPAGDEEEISQFLDSAQQALDELEQDPALLLSGDDPFVEVRQFGERYGFEACAQ